VSVFELQLTANKEAANKTATVIFFIMVPGLE
jgi:hypothetical protein